jgi:hypothetical protein
MASTEAERSSDQGGFGRVFPETPVENSRHCFSGSAGNQGILINLHCTGCGENISEKDVFDVTEYRSSEQGPDEVSFICPLCGAASTSLRTGRI